MHLVNNIRTDHVAFEKRKGLDKSIDEEEEELKDHLAVSKENSAKKDEKYKIKVSKAN